MKIFKYQLPIEAENAKVMLPEGAVILSLQVQNGEPCMWALVDDAKPPVVRWLRWAGTGHYISIDELRDLNFIGTVQLGAYVFHLFEKIR